MGQAHANTQKKIVTILGARPQFVKAAVLSRLIRTGRWSEVFQEKMVHTGQHYDDNMSAVFFREMEIPSPDYQLEAGGTTHGKMTGRMLIGIEDILLRENPDLVIVYGDTNTTLAGALAASKLHIPVAHIEAGLRSFNKHMPEEQNRIIADNLATWLFCPTDKAVENLKVENITKGVHQVGDIMLDATIFYRKKIQNYQSKFVSNQTSFVLATLHREENTENEIRLGQIMEALNALPVDIILPLHPRTRKKIEALNFLPAKHIQLTEPLGYFEMLALEQKASCIITDSGGVQKEAYFMQKPCITLRNETEWTETVDTGWNILVGASKDKIMNAFNNILIPVYHPDLYGNGTTAEQILTALAEKL